MWNYQGHMNLIDYTMRKVRTQSCSLRIQTASRDESKNLLSFHMKKNISNIIFYKIHNLIKKILN